MPRIHLHKWLHMIKYINIVSISRESSPYSATIANPIAPAAITVPHIDHCGTKDAVLGATFASTLDTPDAVAVHCSPHAYPSGQQLPPWLAGQLNQALGHDPP